MRPAVLSWRGKNAGYTPFGEILGRAELYARQSLGPARLPCRNFQEISGLDLKNVRKLHHDF
jgi:hypothetical protein